MRKPLGAWGILALSYLAFAIFWIVGIVVAAGAVALAGRRSWRTALVIALLSPIPVIPMACFAGGVVAYLSGEAQMRTVGLPRPEFYNLDRELRCYWSTSGCIVNESEWMTQGSNNAAVRWMTSWYGPMKGRYTGPYPTRFEAFNALETSAQEIPFAESRLPATADRAEIQEELGAAGPIRVADWKGATILLGSRTRCLLIASDSGELYARYLAER